MSTNDAANETRSDATSKMINMHEPCTQRGGAATE